MNNASTQKKGSFDRSRKIRLYISILIVLASIGVLCLLGEFARGILSSLVAFSQLESSYSRNQQAAIFELQRYVYAGSDESDQRFVEQMVRTMGYETARLELEKFQPDFAAVYEGV